MKTQKRIFALLITLTLAISLLPAASLGESAPQGTYLESTVTLPEGYTSMTSIAAKPDGSVAAAAQKSDTGEWVLMTWADISAAPEVTPLAFTGSGITQISYAPDGSLLIISNDMMLPAQPPQGQAGGPQAEGNGAQVQVGGPQAEAGGAQVQVGGPQAEGNSAQVQVGGPQAEGNGAQAQGGGLKQKAGGKNVISSLDDISNTATWFNADGTLGGSFQIKGLVTQAAALNNKQTAVLERQSGINIYDEQGSSLSGIAASGIYSIAASGETLFALSMDKLTQYDIKSGDKLNTVDISTDATGRVAVGPDGVAYIMDSTGLYTVKPGDSQQTMLMDAIGTLIGDPSNAITGMTIMKDGTVVAMVEEGTGSFGGKTMRIGTTQSSTLAAYRYTDAADIGAKQDFTITSLYSSAKLRKAASDFQKLHPELNVKLQTQLAEDDESPVEDRIRTLNTDLLAGKGGDVLILDGLPVEKYAQRGILKDLSDLLKDVAFLPGIRAGSTSADGKVYAVPAQFSFELLWGNASTVSAIQNFTDLPSLALASGQTLLNPRTYQEWLRLFYPASEPQFLNESGQQQFDSPAFESFLETLYQLYVQQGDMPFEEMPPAKGGIVPAEVAAMLNGAAALFPATVNSLMELSMAYTVSGGEESGFTTVPSLSGAGYGYTPSLMAGINAQSQNQALADEFVLTLYSAELQALDQMEGLPTVAAALDQQFADALERNEGGDGLKKVQMFALPGMNPIEVKQPGEATWQNLRALCDQITVPIRADETLLGFITDETEAFFAGSITAQEAAQAVQQRAWAYLNE